MAISNKYPYTDFHELNLDWFLDEFFKLQTSFDNVQQTVNEFTDFVTHYFENLDVQEMVNEWLTELQDNGTLQAYINERIDDMAPATIEGWLDANITQPSTPVIDTSLTIEGAGADALIAGQSIRKGGAFNLLSQIWPKADYTAADYSFTWQDHCRCRAIGLPTVQTRFGNIYMGPIAGSLFSVGKTYFGSIDSTKVSLMIYAYADTTWNVRLSEIQITNKTKAFYIPQGTQGLIIRLWMASGTTTDEIVEPVLYEAAANPDITQRAAYNYGDFSSDECNFADRFSVCGDVNINSTFFISFSGTTPALAGFPLNHAGWLTTIVLGTGSNVGRFQIAYPWTTWDDVIMYRAYTSGTWTEWESLDTYNRRSKMLSFGNSILTGSVWLDGHYDHLCRYANAPYGRIADAIGIARKNVEHTLMSSTGILALGDDNTNFHDAILAVNDFSDYDVVLTHFWYRDMNFTFAQLKTAIEDILSHIALTNRECEFVLIGAPPANATAGYYGQNVFTAIYSNGHSIAELDAEFRSHAASHHYIFVDYEDLNMSYCWQDLTDGSNVHLNNDQGYRVTGGYLGGRIAAKFTV